VQHTFQPKTVQVPLGDLRYLCQLAREAGEDLQVKAWQEYPDNSQSTASTVRRRNRDLSHAQQVIDAANRVASAGNIVLKEGV
jgi:hypothetical protein